MTTEPMTHEQQQLNAMTHEQRMEYWARATAKNTGTVATVAVLWVFLALVGVIVLLATNA